MQSCLLTFSYGSLPPPLSTRLLKVSPLNMLITSFCPISYGVSHLGVCVFQLKTMITEKHSANYCLFFLSFFFFYSSSKKRRDTKAKTPEFLEEIKSESRKQLWEWIAVVQSSFLMNPLKHETLLNRRKCWANNQTFRVLTSQALLWCSDVLGVEETGGGPSFLGDQRESGGLEVQLQDGQEELSKERFLCAGPHPWQKAKKPRMQGQYRTRWWELQSRNGKQKWLEWNEMQEEVLTFIDYLWTSFTLIPFSF